MARWKVTQAQKGPRGSITGVGGPSFGFLPARSDTHTYLVRGAPFETEVRVVEGEGQTILVSTGGVLSSSCFRTYLDGGAMGSMPSPQAR